MPLVNRVDRWLFPAGKASTVLFMRRALAFVIALRLTFGPYARYGGQSDALFRPAGIMHLFSSMPSAEVITFVQIIGAVAAWLVVFNVKARWIFPICFTALLFCAGAKGSLGKILHNDVLLLLVSATFLFIPRLESDPEDPSRRYGWIPQFALIVTSLVYFATGVAKVRHSGIEWVTSDNVRWVMEYGARSGRAPTEAIARIISANAWFAHLVAATAIIGELLFPVAMFSKRSRPVFATIAVSIHVLTWLTLGLDYWGWALTALIVFVPEQLQLAWAKFAKRRTLALVRDGVPRS